MARAEQRVTGRTSRPARSYNSYQVNSYVDGNTVRRLNAVPDSKVRRPRQTSSATRNNRERALQMNLTYVLFLTIAAVVTVMVCINYLKLQSQNVSYQKSVTALDTRLSEMKMENDSAYNRVIASVDLEHVKDVAMNELGMVYASDKQICMYDSTQSDYVKQYQELPAE